MDLQTWAFILSTLALVGGLVRWIVAVWWKSNKELTEVKASHAASAFRNLQGVVDEHRDTLFEVTKRLHHLETELKLAVTKLDSVKTSMADVTISFKEFSQKSDEKLAKLASENIKLAKELILIKNKSYGGTTK